MRTLVTGASGFIGQHVLRLLKEAGGGDVWGVGRTRPLDILPGVEYVQVDLLSANSLSDLIASVRPTHLVHLAWHTPVRGFWTAPANFDWAAATLALMQAFVAHGGQHAVMAGTCAEYDWDNQGALREDSPTRPNTFYGAMKESTGRAIVAAGRQFGVPVGWGRIFWTYGPHEARGRLVSDAACALRDGLPVRTTAGTQRRDFLHVHDVARALMMALDREWSGPFNVASGTALPIRSIVEVLAEAANRPELLEIGALPSRADDPDFVVGDTRVLARDIGFNPTYSLHEGLSETYRWWCDQKA